MAADKAVFLHPRVFKVCGCGALLRRIENGRGAFRYLWIAEYDELSFVRPRLFRSEGAAGVHCAADLGAPSSQERPA